MMLLLLASAIAFFFSCWAAAKCIAIVALLGFVVIFWKWPMNVVYGLMGTSGSISKFVIGVLVINLVFSAVYFGAFFNNAGITYDVNQPYISYNMYQGFTCRQKRDSIIERTTYDTSYVKAISPENTICDDSMTYEILSSETHHYQHIGYGTILQNTFITSLMQEPTDLFANAITANKNPDVLPQDLGSEIEDFDTHMSSMLGWVLTLQLFISWIFFGVFISLLYNKFRYES